MTTDFTGDVSMKASRRQVLIVDDDRFERTSLRKKILIDRQHTYVIRGAESVDEAIECIGRQLPDCILLDYALPGHNGLKLLEYLQNHLADQPIAVILITGRGDQSVTVEALRGGALDYLTKDEVSPDRLHQAVESAMETVRMRRQLISQRRELEAKNRELEEVRQRLEDQNGRLVSNQHALLNMMDDLEREVRRRREAEQLV